MNSLVERHLRAFATKALQTFPVLVIEGARQVGKSTFAGHSPAATPHQPAPPHRGQPLGPLLEGFVAAELTRQQGWSLEEFRVGHFRDRNGLEVDLIIELGDGRVIGIEVKAAQTLRADDFRGLGSLRDRLGDRFVRGVVLYTGNRSVPFGDRLSGMPVCALWEPPG